MPFIFQEAERRARNNDFQKDEYINSDRHTESVIFVQKAANAPITKQWKAGIRIKDAKPGDISPGTAIATFDKNGKYPTVEGKHAAIYLSHTSVSIKILDQWKKKQTVLARSIDFNRPSTTRLSENADNYYVIEYKTGGNKP